MRSTFGPYTRLFEIGRGGMATVYRATAPDGNLVALKLLGIHLAADKTAISRFKTESQLGLDHPNIVRVNNAGVIEEIPFIEMEYVAGESLDRLILRQGSLTPAHLSPILDDAARALDYAHGKGVVHRDVKPSNMLIRSDGRAMLADFGVAKAANITAYTATAARVGSVFYMSPEQAAGAYNITKASDIYSLGVTAYYALSGRHPFEGDNDVAIARQHVDHLPPHLSVVNPRVPRAVGDAVMRALEKNPERRPTSAGAFAAAFTIALTAPPVIAPPVVLPEPVKSASLSVESASANPSEVEGGGPIPRSTWLLIGTIAGFALLLLAAVLIFALTNSSTTPPRGTSTPSIGVIATASPVMTVDSVLTPIATIIVQTIAPTAGSTVIFVFPTANVPATATPQVINPIFPSPTPAVFPTLPPPPIFPTAPPPTWTPLPTITSVPPTATTVPPTATTAPPTATSAPTNTPLPPTDTPVPPPTDTPAPPPTVTPTPPVFVTVVIAP